VFILELSSTHLDLAKREALYVYDEDALVSREEALLVPAKPGVLVSEPHSAVVGVPR